MVFAQTILTNGTITTSGSSTAYIGFGNNETSLIINITGPVTGSSPTITFTIQEVDPGNGSTTLGVSKSGAALTGVSTQIITIPNLTTGSVIISWVVTGSTPSFGGIYATLADKLDTPYIYDLNGNGPVAVKPASTAAIATDPALVVAVSPNNSVTVTQATAANLKAQTASESTTATTTGTVASLVGGAVTTAAPTYTTGQMDPLSLTTAGALRTDSSATTQPVSGTVTANQGTANTLTNGWPVKVTDGTNTMPTADVAARAQFDKITDGTNTAAVKAASTAPVAADPALVVSVSPNTSLTVGISQSDVTATGSLGALNATVSIILAGTNNSAMQLVAGTLIGTIVPEVSVDGGTTWVGTYFDDPVTGNKSSSVVFASNNTATTRTIIGAGGASNARIRVSAYTSGTATCNLRASTTYDSTLTSEGSIGAATTPPTGVQIGGSNPLGSFTGAITSASGAIGTAIMGNEFLVQTNATVTTSGSQTITKNFYGVQQVNLVVNVTGSITGTTPTITYTIQELDPGNNTTVFGNSASTSIISSAGVYTAILTTTTSSSVKVSWTVTGSSPSFGGVYATVISKATPSSQQITTSATAAIPGNAQGYTTTSATTNVALSATTYTEQSANFTGSIASASANDTSAGTGARTVRIFYVDATGATAGTEDATLNGTTGVNLVTTTKCFIEKIQVLTVGSTGSNVGIISLYSAAAKGGTVIATITATDNQTYLGHHYVVSGKTCNISGITGFNNNSNNQSVFTLQSTVLPVANQASVQVSDWVTGGLTFQVVRLYDQLIKVSGPARIQMFVQPGGTPTILNRGSFDYYDQ